MGVASLLVPLASARCSCGAWCPGRAATPATRSSGTAVGAAAVTTVADRLAGHEPDEPDDPRDRWSTTTTPARRAAASCGAGPARCAGSPARWRSAPACSPPPPGCPSRTNAKRMWEKGQRHDLGGGPLPCGGRHRRLGLHLLLEPPVHARGAGAVGAPRRAPLERALQPLHRAAAAGGRRARRVPALRADGPASASGRR